MKHFISLATAQAMTAKYRTHKEQILADAYKNQNLLAICESYDKASFSALINQNGCEGVRIYYGMDEELRVHAIIVGVNGYNEDILPSDQVQLDEGYIVDTGNRCPELCPPKSALNG